MSKRRFTRVDTQENQPEGTGDLTNWSIHLTDSVDDFRYYRGQWMIEESFELDNDHFGAMPATTATGRFDNENPPQSVEAEDRSAVLRKLVESALPLCGQ
jgi:hypothetical protein